MTEGIPADPWADLTAALDAMNREAVRRQLGRPIGGMFFGDHTFVENSVFHTESPSGPDGIISHWSESSFPIDAPSLTMQQVRADDDDE